MVKFNSVSNSFLSIIFFIKNKNNDLVSFQNGVDTIVSGCTTYGSTPSSNTPSKIVEAIKAIYNNRYTAGVTATKKGNATAAQVLSGKTFTNSSTVNGTGTMTNNGGTTKSATCALDTTNKYVTLTIPANAYYNTSAKLYATYATVASKIGLTAAKIVKGNTILGIAGTATAAPTKLNGTVSVGKKVWGAKVNGTVTFTTAFSKAPTVQITASGGTHGKNGVDYVKTTSITKAGFVWELEVAGTPDAGYTTLTLTWNAVV